HRRAIPRTEVELAYRATRDIDGAEPRVGRIDGRGHLDPAGELAAARDVARSARLCRLLHPHERPLRTRRQLPRTQIVTVRRAHEVDERVLVDRDRRYPLARAAHDSERIRIAQ